MYTQIANKLRTFAIILLIASIVFCSIGFYKKDVYDGDGYFSPNAYVGGDAYNYIINGNYATAFFVLTLTFAMLGIGFCVLAYMRKMPMVNTTGIINNFFVIPRPSVPKEPFHRLQRLCP